MIESVAAATLAAGIVLVFTGPLGRWLRGGNLRREVRVDTPETHQAKQGTPSMGGLVLCFAVAAACLLIRPSLRSLGLVAGMSAFGLLGFWDDLVKATARPGLGLRARYKSVVQVALAALAVWLLMAVFQLETAVHLPPSFAPLPLGWVFFPLAAVILIATTNATNIADGLDGLAAGVLCLCFGTLAAFSAAEGLVEVATFTGAAAGACATFLWFNRHPARIWMGDTGSMGLGAGLALAALAAGKELLLPVLGIVLVVDAVTVILQVIVFQTTGKRVFRIAPIHHAFEMRGWPETRVVAAAWGLTAVGVAAATGLWLVGR